MYNLLDKEYLSGPYDECIDCEFLRVACSGPRTNAMDLPRWIVWIKRVMKRFGITNKSVADNTPLSKSTVDDLLAGRRKSIDRDTCCYIENYVLGDGKWPCAKRFAEGQDVVYEDRPETLEALRVAQEALTERNAQMEAARKSYEDDVSEYKALVSHMRQQIDRKDDYIDRLAKKAGI